MNTPAPPAEVQQPIQAIWSGELTTTQRLLLLTQGGEANRAEFELEFTPPVTTYTSGDGTVYTLTRSPSHVKVEAELAREVLLRFLSTIVGGGATLPRQGDQVSLYDQSYSVSPDPCAASTPSTASGSAEDLLDVRTGSPDHGGPGQWEVTAYITLAPVRAGACGTDSFGYPIPASDLPEEVLTTSAPDRVRVAVGISVPTD